MRRPRGTRRNRRRPGRAGAGTGRESGWRAAGSGDTVAGVGGGHMSTMAPPPPAPAAPALMTAEEFARQYADRRAELVKGRVVELPMPNLRHGKVCNWASFYLTRFVIEHDLGHVMTNDSWVVVERGPDTVRGA